MANQSVAQSQLRAFIERLGGEKQAIADDIEEIYGEANGSGLDAKVLRQLVRIRKMDHIAVRSPPIGPQNDRGSA